MKSHKIVAEKIQHLFHAILWSKYFLPGILLLVLAITLVELCLNIFKPPDINEILTWRLWVIFVFSTIGTFSGLCGTYFINRRSIKWVYFQFVTIPALFLALAFSILPLQALMWLGMSIPAVIMYKDWNRQTNPNSIHPKKLPFKWLFSFFILAIILSLILGVIILEINIKTNYIIDIAPFADAFILVFTLSAPFLLAKRYWVGQYFFAVANIVSILLFSGAIGGPEAISYLFMIQNIVLLFYAITGISSWIVIYNKQHN